MKKIISMLLSVAMVAAMSVSVMAEESKKITVVVDDRVINFKDQEPVISENNDTLIPVRGVLEAMDATVEWDGEERSVFVKSYDKITRVKVYLDNPVMTKYTVKSVMQVDAEEITLSTAPRLMNERTMIPLRVISENLGALVDWDGDNRLITITTKEYAKFKEDNQVADEESGEMVYDAKASLPVLYIETEAEDVAADEEFKVNLKMANTDKIEEGYVFGGLTLTMDFDKEKVECKEIKIMLNGQELNSNYQASNPNFNGMYKFVYIVDPSKDEYDLTLTDGTIAELTFVTDGEEQEIAISNAISSIGFDTSVMVKKAVDDAYELNTAEEIYIDTTPIVIK